MLDNKLCRDRCEEATRDASDGRERRLPKDNHECTRAGGLPIRAATQLGKHYRNSITSLWRRAAPPPLTGSSNSGSRNQCAARSTSRKPNPLRALQSLGDAQ